MSNYDLIGTLYDTAGNLLKVQYSLYDAEPDGQDWIDAIELRFEHAIASVYAEADFDTVRVELAEVKTREGCSVKDATSIKPWAAAIGASPSWIWLLRNQQGYEDGIRFEFPASRSGAQETVVTLVVLASRIQVFSSEEVKLPSDATA